MHFYGEDRKSKKSGNLLIKILQNVLLKCVSA